MNKFIAFLRAINVGGHKSVKMEDLRQIFESFGLANVQTYIQSGNVIFDWKDNDAAQPDKLEDQLEKELGYKVDIFLRTLKEVTAIANQKLYEPKDNETLHIVFLNEPPGKKLQRALMAFNSEADDFTVKGREVYNLRRDREKSVFSNNFVEKILKVPATTRNLTTIRKIVEKFK
ncbi:MAG: DUF1697 domain-containing protein [Chloroflexi bacterium]|nr:DUF1697 domain-containing protein [Chloroflexota bacterium]